MRHPFRTADPKPMEKQRMNPAKRNVIIQWAVVVILVAATGELHDMNLGLGKEGAADLLCIFATVWAVLLTVWWRRDIEQPRR